MRYVPTIAASGFAAFSLGCLSVTSAAAQDTGQDSDDQVIIVEGTVEVDGTEARRQARDITAERGSTANPLARFRRPICPGVWGLSQENAELIANRIYDNAERIGLEINDTPECDANLWVIFVDDPESTFADLEEENGWMVRDLQPSERNAVTDQTGPVRAWSVASTRTEDGTPINTGFDAAGANLENRMNPNAGGSPIAPTTNMSRLRTAIRRDLDQSFVLIQRSAIADLDALAVADYATMRTFARTEEPSQSGTYSTVLSLFQDDSAPDRITAFDISYLRSLYTGDGMRPGSRTFTSLDENMEEELLGEQ
ncbi:hypothetical protein [Aurantiacibacter sediminis]|uniref:DUF2927 domain-containing protein n=1 Tax=Aurantiacibacter sediminis TaxID=2793064 RepID=A0ABS0N1W1_9SPHN|nr:hypothetical protein [Aurantiacibacter sediminis]MBH5321932.1 hypothetical protein [Aurantiacibacter sediminis]